MAFLLTAAHLRHVMHMKNGLIEKAIEEFKNRRLGVYKADPEQIVRDTRVAERATKDHVGRWLFELLQNSDDAEASAGKRCQILTGCCPNPDQVKSTLIYHKK
jgi:hypothetical protein